MAKGRFLAFLGGLAAAAIKANSQRRRELEENYRRELKKAESELAEEQAAYEQYILSLPALRGNGRFTQEVDTTYGEMFALDSYSQYLELMHEPGQHFTVLLEYQPGEGEGSIRVEGGEATLGHIPLDQEDYLCDFLEELGNEVTCNAQLTKLVHGGYDLYLDIARPPRVVD
jgi:hypothetical protein